MLATLPAQLLSQFPIVAKDVAAPGNSPPTPNPRCRRRMFGHGEPGHERVDQIVGDIFGFGRAAPVEIETVTSGQEFQADAFGP